MRKLFMKDEGHDDDGRMTGPLYWVDCNDESIHSNYEDNKDISPFPDGSGRYHAKWFNLKEAKAIAKREGVEFEY